MNQKLARLKKKTEDTQTAARTSHEKTWALSPKILTICGEYHDNSCTFGITDKDNTVNSYENNCYSSQGSTTATNNYDEHELGSKGKKRQ